MPPVSSFQLFDNKWTQTSVDVTLSFEMERKLAQDPITHPVGSQMPSQRSLQTPSTLVVTCVSTFLLLLALGSPTSHLCGCSVLSGSCRPGPFPDFFQETKHLGVWQILRKTCRDGVCLCVCVCVCVCVCRGVPVQNRYSNRFNRCLLSVLESPSVTTTLGPSSRSLFPKCSSNYPENQDPRISLTAFVLARVGGREWGVGRIKGRPWANLWGVKVCLRCSPYFLLN